MADELDDVFPSEPEAANEERTEPVIAAPESAEQQEPASVETPPAEVKPEPGYVPLDAMLTERERRQTAERERDELRRVNEQRNAPQATPDPFDDPKAYDAYQEQRLNAALVTQKVEMSRILAARDHGAEQVEAARVWALEKAEKDPGFRQQLDVEIGRQTLPYDWIVQQHKRDGMIEQIGDKSMDDFVREYIAKNPGIAIPASVAAATIPVAASPQQASPPVKVPRSLATQGSGPSDIRHVPAGPLAAVDALFT